MDSPILLSVEELRKAYPDGWTLESVSFTVHVGEIVGVLGPSGSGKTTLLRLLAGLENPDSGGVSMAGRDVLRVPPHRRQIGLMFQEYALFPHRDVFGNVAFGLEMQAIGRPEIGERVARVLDLVGLTGYERRDVNQLSGGERQRVALARSLAPRPRLLMLDEPLGSLDRTLRERLIEELPRILQEAGVTVITVTHDQEEAFAIADRIVLMRRGRVVQIGTPEAVYREPADVWTARFLGLTNLLPAKVGTDGWVRTKLGAMQVCDASYWPTARTDRLHLLIRPEAARLGSSDGPNRLEGVVSERSFRGGFYRFVVAFPSGVRLAFVMASGGEVPEPGERAVISLDPRSMALLPTN